MSSSIFERHSLKYYRDKNVLHRIRIRIRSRFIKKYLRNLNPNSNKSRPDPQHGPATGNYRISTSVAEPHHFYADAAQAPAAPAPILLYSKAKFLKGTKV
jgi:hypothetical protein